MHRDECTALCPGTRYPCCTPAVGLGHRKAAKATFCAVYLCFPAPLDLQCSRMTVRHPLPVIPSPLAPLLSAWVRLPAATRGHTEGSSRTQWLQLCSRAHKARWELQTDVHIPQQGEVQPCNMAQGLHRGLSSCHSSHPQAPAMCRQNYKH